MAPDSGNPGRQTRPGRHLHLKELNVEKGSSRFSVRGDLFPPNTAAWRNNLIAFSQRRNLLFAAYRQYIYVWEPAGSLQSLGSLPEMIITPVMKAPYAQGYISPQFPHAINNILVDDLGRDEVLLLATDSGNVCGYRVEAIYLALERAAEEGKARPLDDYEINPFFAEYVNSSAWGLSIHKFARLIAVSANTGLVTVFAFALVDPSSDDGNDSSPFLEFKNDQPEYGQTWETVDTSEKFMRLRELMPDRHRSHNIRLTYTGHFTNIPSVSFLNSDLDPNGNWMVSTDIDNKLLVWKIWQSLGPFTVRHFNEFTSRAFPRNLHNDERGWTVLALDPRTFQPYDSVEEACGGDPSPLIGDSRRFVDVTKLCSQIPNVSRLYNYFPPEAKPEREAPTLPDFFGPECRISGHNGIRWSSEHTGLLDNSHSLTRSQDDIGEASQNLGEDTENADLGSSGVQGQQISSGTVNPATWDSEIGTTDEDSSDGDVDMDAIEFRPTSSQEAGSADESGSTTSSPDLERDNDAHAEPFVHLALLDALGGAPIALNEYFDNPFNANYNDDNGSGGDNNDDDVHEPVDAEIRDIVDTEDDNSRAGGPSGFTAYQVFDRMLRGAFPDDPNLYGRTKRLTDQPPPPAASCSDFPILHFSETDIRLIPHAFAPHVGAVCGAPLKQLFTHLVTSIHSCDRFNMVKYVPEYGIVVAASQKGRAAIIALTRCGDRLFFRVDWIVPFMNQERYGDRPLRPLLGMSVSPMQGFEMPSDAPFIPRDSADLDHLAFHYKTMNEDDGDDEDVNGDSDNSSAPNLHDDNHVPSGADGSCSSSSARFQTDATYNSADTQNIKGNAPIDSDSESTRPQTTLPELHAGACRAYRPHEAWRGWHHSRHYRLFLMYHDHTVMSYEFWYGRSPGSKGHNYPGVGDEVKEDIESDDSGYPPV